MMAKIDINEVIQTRNDGFLSIIFPLIDID